MMVSCGGTDSVEGPVALLVTKTSADCRAGSMFVEVTASLDWTITLETDNGQAWAQAEPASGRGSKANVVLSYSENTSEADRVLRIILRSGTKSCTETFTQKGKAAAEVPGPVTGPGDTAGRYGLEVTSCGWLELPATKVDGKEFFHLDMSVNGEKVRNYSYDWDLENLVSHWVAYPLNKNLCGNGKFDYLWGLDPNLPVAAQSNISLRGYGDSQMYARGHQLPRADRQISQETVAQTCYGTNMTPQLHGFNSGIWLNLENMVRTWGNALSSSDTLYVVTGCILSDDPMNGNRAEVGGYTLDNDGKKVAIPVAYYKAVLRYQKNSTYGFQGYTACGFYLEHEAASSSVSKSMALSIDELEELTGQDFFVNLPALIGESDAEKVESQNPQNVGIWW
ncbi:MAG: DNA/RNA non-specific endonuclease [Candidatus Cryptobacteroides sp.]